MKIKIEIEAITSRTAHVGMIAKKLMKQMLQSPDFLNDPRPTVSITEVFDGETSDTDGSQTGDASAEDDFLPTPAAQFGTEFNVTKPKPRKRGHK
jgi:hypothetical protein